MTILKIEKNTQKVQRKKSYGHIFDFPIIFYGFLPIFFFRSTHKYIVTGSLIGLILHCSPYSAITGKANIFSKSKSGPKIWPFPLSSEKPNFGHEFISKVETKGKTLCLQIWEEAGSTLHFFNYQKAFFYGRKFRRFGSKKPFYKTVPSLANLEGLFWNAIFFCSSLFQLKSECGVAIAPRKLKIAALASSFKYTWKFIYILLHIVGLRTRPKFDKYSKKTTAVMMCFFCSQA
uniref:Uncharacterized protein n=1 Tax=Cacopsylla melanoneura TaxID=428564 RepID=A0A8D8RYV1_9HEMI